MKVVAIISLKADHRLDLLLDIAELARSTFFYHQAKLSRPDPQSELKTAIHNAFYTAKGRYGHRRVHLELTKAGWRVAKKTVLRLMGQLGLACQVRRKRYNSFKGQIGQVAPNLLERDFTAEAPNQKWVTDVTEFRIGDRKIYLSPVMDLFDRSILGYTWGTSPSLQLTNTSLKQALATLQPNDHRPLVHSDQGFQYQHVSWRNLLAVAGAKQSMSRKGNCLDNAVIECFFGHLKEELFHHTRFITLEAFTSALDAYMHWYNTIRTHTRLEGLSPVEYRAQALAA